VATVNFELSSLGEEGTSFKLEGQRRPVPSGRCPRAKPSPVCERFYFADGFAMMPLSVNSQGGQHEAPLEAAARMLAHGSDASCFFGLTTRPVVTRGLRRVRMHGSRGRPWLR
jgi:hypothetical protein